MQKPQKYCHFINNGYNAVHFRQWLQIHAKIYSIIIQHVRFITQMGSLAFTFSHCHLLAIIVFIIMSASLYDSNSCFQGLKFGHFEFVLCC